MTPALDPSLKSDLHFGREVKTNFNGDLRNNDGNDVGPTASVALPPPSYAGRFGAGRTQRGEMMPGRSISTTIYQQP
jgi:hypothetical protein